VLAAVQERGEKNLRLRSPHYLLASRPIYGMAPPMTTRKSKIARLPFNIRKELNHQIMDNVPTKDILRCPHCAMDRGGGKDSAAAGGRANPARSPARKSIRARDRAILQSPVSVRFQASRFAIPLSKKYGGSCLKIHLDSP